MGEAEFQSVVDHMRLPDGQVFPMPVVLDMSTSQAETAQRADAFTLTFRGEEVGELLPSSWFRYDKSGVARAVYGTTDTRHPGVAHLLGMGDLLVGGPVRLTRRAVFEYSACDLTPADTRACFARQGWTTVTGFQTRNIPHRAHEHLLRLALEFTDGLFVQPLVGWKKKGDCAPSAILTSYRALIDNFLPRDRVRLGVLSTSMRYAGPREAVFHAIVRRNYGCTHFIVGRDHAGVGDYYGRYEAQTLARRLEPELGIAILPFAGPFACTRCGGIVTERTCPHGETQPGATTQISGTAVRGAIAAGAECPAAWIRPEVLDSLRGLPTLITEDAP
jgi:sulfate adenylyltransferase